MLHKPDISPAEHKEHVYGQIWNICDRSHTHGTEFADRVEAKQAKTKGESQPSMGKHNFRNVMFGVCTPEKKQKRRQRKRKERSTTAKTNENIMFQVFIHIAHTTLPLTSIACCFSLRFLFHSFLEYFSLVFGFSGEENIFSLEKISWSEKINEKKNPK